MRLKISSSKSNHTLTYLRLAVLSLTLIGVVQHWYLERVYRRRSLLLQETQTDEALRKLAHFHLVTERLRLVIKLLWSITTIASLLTSERRSRKVAMIVVPASIATMDFLTYREVKRVRTLIAHIRERDKDTIEERG